MFSTFPSTTAPFGAATMAQQPNPLDLLNQQTRPINPMNQTMTQATQQPQLRAQPGQGVSAAFPGAVPVFQALVDQSRQLNKHVTPSELPQVERGLEQVESESRRLASRAARDGGFDLRA